MISPSVPELSVRVVENGDAIVDAEVSVMRDNSGALAHAAVEITFRAGQWVRRYPASGDVEAIPPGLFEREVHEIAEGDEGLRSFHELWQATGNCPDPQFYEVLDSPWIVSMNAARFRARHFVVQGHDMWLEVLALEFAWKWSTRRASAIELS